MTYQVLARKWRPQDFASLVGQDQIVTALRNGLREGRIAQAYLFSGIRGVGKTTAARVLAKALNCERRADTDGDPCNECPSCQEIAAGNTMDVIEVDAATYSKVEQVRELTETLRYGPAKNKYKVVVLDEVHRLSKQAFDALLKIVEEPPAHLVFIFATTEIDAVPATILSRCQEFQFRRVPSPVLAEHLRRICTAESIEVSDIALRLIARAGEGSVRDSVALLDQMATFGRGEITDDDAKKLLGGLDSAIFQKLLTGILSGEHQPILDVVADVEVNGWDPHNVYSQFLSFSRDALHLSLGAAPESVDLPEEERAALKQVLQPFGYESLLQVLQLLISSEGMVRRSELGLLALEIAWLRAAELPKIQSLQDLLSGRATLPSVASSAPATPGRLPSGPLEARSPSLPTRSVRGTDIESVASPPSIADPGSTPDEPVAQSVPENTAPPAQDLDPSRIPALLEILGSRRQALAAHMRKAALTAQQSQLRIHPPSGDTLLQRSLDRPRNREALEQAIQEVWGPGCSWSIGPPQTGSFKEPTPIESVATPIKPSSKPVSMSSPPTQSSVDSSAVSPKPAPPSSRLSSQELEIAANLPTVKTALEIFGGKIRSIEPRISEPKEQNP